MSLIIFWFVGTIILGGLISMTARWLGSGVIIGAFTGSLVLAILIAPKLGLIPGFESPLSASIFIYCATFIFTDVLSEIFGSKKARTATYAAILMYPMILLTTQFATQWQVHPFYTESQDAFSQVMNQQILIIIASIISFSCSQLHDVWAFEFWKKKTNGKHLWLRNNASTIVSQAIDTILFYSIGFYFLPISGIVSLIVFTYIVKIIIALADTPVVYFVVNFIKNGEKYKNNELV